MELFIVIYFLGVIACWFVIGLLNSKTEIDLDKFGALWSLMSWLFLILLALVISIYYIAHIKPVSKFWEFLSKPENTINKIKELKTKKSSNI